MIVLFYADGWLVANLLGTEMLLKIASKKKYKLVKNIFCQTFNFIKQAFKLFEEAISQLLMLPNKH
jgi:hypothetical protein